MYSRLLFTALLCIPLVNLFAVTDSVSLGAAKDQTVFYSMKNGNVSTVKNDNWHLAFSCRPAQFPDNTLQSATIRINEAYGVKVFRVPNKVVADFQTVDTTGWQNWRQIHDSDTSWWTGAFNRNKDSADLYNYGWGEYSFAGHSVVGDSLYLIRLPNGSFKKFEILKNEYDTCFLVQYANLDNSQTTNTKLLKKANKTKNFIYLDLASATILDWEPISANWDWQYCVYANSVGKRVMGILMNDHCSAKTTGGNPTLQCVPGEKYNPRLNGLNPYGTLNDTLPSAIIPENEWLFQSNGDYYKISFGTTNPTTNTINFTVSNCSTTGIRDASESIAKLYPNPVNNVLHIELVNHENTTLRVIDITGNILSQTVAATNLQTVDVEGLADGIYFLQTQKGSDSFVQKFVVSH